MLSEKQWLVQIQGEEKAAQGMDNGRSTAAASTTLLQRGEILFKINEFAST